MWVLLFLLACWGRDAYILHGTVVEVRSGSVIIDHGRLKDGTPPGKDSYQTRGTLGHVQPGDRVTARIMRQEHGHVVDQIRVQGTATANAKRPQKGSRAFPLEGVVVRVEPPDTLVVDHEAIEGFMAAMVMPLTVTDPAVLETLAPGDYIQGTLRVGTKTVLDGVSKVGQGDAPVMRALLPIKPGQAFPRLELTAHDGRSLVVGPGQDRPTALTFLYTSCPIPEYCPATVARLQALQAALGTDANARIVALTLDPDNDTVAALATFASETGADPRVWTFARTDDETLRRAAMRSALSVKEQDGEIFHALRLVVLDRNGVLIERYDDNHWPLDRVVSQLTRGEPLAPPNSSGTLTPK